MSVDPDDDKTVFLRLGGGPGPLPVAQPATLTPTQIRRPASARTALPTPMSAPAPSAVPAAHPSASPASNVSPLIAAASPLLQLLAQLRMAHHASNPHALRARVVQDLGTFQRQAREMGIAMDLLRPAHYALCASIDDVVLNTPWGAASGWAGQTLLAAFHRGARGTDQVFDDLRQMRNRACQIPSGHRAELSLSLARFHGPVPGGSRRRGTGEPAKRSTRRHRGPAPGSRTGAVAALARRDGAVPAAAARRAGLGRAGRRCRTVWRAAVLDVDDPECRLGRPAGPCARDPAGTHAAGRAGRGCGAATAAGPARTHRPRPASLQPAGRHRQHGGRGAGYPGHANRPYRGSRDVRAGQRNHTPGIAAGAGARRRGAATRSRIHPGDRLYRQPASPHRAVSFKLPAFQGARQRGPHKHRPQSWRSARVAVPRAGRMRTRSRPIPLRRDANRTSGSRSCCAGWTDGR